MQRCRFHVDEICTTCRFHEDKICKRAYFMGITTFYILFTIPTGTFYSTCPIQKDRHQRIQRRQAAFLFSLIFLIAASHAASIFLCCVYGSHSFPYCFNCCKPCSFLFFYAAFVGLLFPLLFVFINHPRAQQLPCFRRFSYFFFKKLIMPRSCAPTCSAWVCAARRRIALNCGRPHWFSSSHFLAKVPS